jgi:uncharacterized membrane protein
MFATFLARFSSAISDSVLCKNCHSQLASIALGEIGGCNPFCVMLSAFVDG